MASPWGALRSRDRPVNLWALPLIFPGTAAVSGQGLAEPTISKSLCKGKGEHCIALAQGLDVCSMSRLAEPGAVGAAGGAMHTPSKKRRPKECLFLPPQSAGQGLGYAPAWLHHPHRMKDACPGLRPLEPPLGGGWECWAHHWPTHSG